MSTSQRNSGTDRKSSARTNRRDFLKSAGLLAVSFGAYAGGWATEADAQTSSAPQGPGPYPNPDFHQIDSWIVIHRGQYGHVLCRQNGSRPGHRNRFPPVDVRRARHRVRQDHLHHGQHGHHRRPGRVGRVDRDGERFLADASRRRGSAPRAARNGVSAPGRAGRSTRGQRRRHHREGRSLEARYVWRADRGKEVQRHADRQQHQRRHRPRQDEAGAGTQIHRPAAASRRHSRRKWTVL